MGTTPLRDMDRLAFAWKRQARMARVWEPCLLRRSRTEGTETGQEQSPEPQNDGHKQLEGGQRG